MSQIENLNSFYDELDSLEKIIKGVDEKLNSKRSKIKSIVYDLSGKLNLINLKDLGLSKELQNFFSSFQTKIESSIKKWHATFEANLKQEKLRSDLRNSFIVIIYGRVKAGKSSLGNFVANNRHSNQNIIFQKYDQNNEVYVLNSGSFATDIAECTDSIQLFKIGGLAWVDTPGLNSMTKKNGELAKNYINAADFIIFPTSSDAPMQRDEIDLINDFINTFHKKISVVITKSDQTIEDEIDEKIVKVTENKSEESRALQSKDVFDRLNAVLKNNSSLLGEIIPISVKTAEIGIKENNKDLFTGSNVGKFLGMINELVLTKANFLKNSSPYDEVKTLISVINNDLVILKDEAGQIKTNLEQFISRMEKIFKSLDIEIKQLVSDSVDKHDKEIVKGSNKSVYEKIVSSCINDFNNICKSKIQKELTGFYENVVIISKDLLNGVNFSVDDIEKEFHKTTTYNTSGSILGGLIGGVAGFFIGGPWGAGIGAGLGSTVGGVGGSQIKDVEVYKTVVGDNRLQVKKQIKEFCEKKCKSLLVEHQEHFSKKFIVPNKRLFNNVYSSISEVSQSLENEMKHM